MDLVWTTGVGNNPPYETASTNLKTGSYSWLHTNTGLPVIVDESAGASQAGERGRTKTAAALTTGSCRRRGCRQRQRDARRLRVER